MQILRNVFFGLAVLAFLLTAVEVKAPAWAQIDLTAAGLLFFTLAVALSGGAN